MAFRNIEGRQFHPIISLDEGEAIACQVTETRDPKGKMQGALIDCRTLQGTGFCLNGHTVLLDKVTEPGVMEADVIYIARAGELDTANGKAFDYGVAVWDGDLASYQSTKEGKTAIVNTEKLVEAKIAALPPTD